MRNDVTVRLHKIIQTQEKDSPLQVKHPQNTQVFRMQPSAGILLPNFKRFRMKPLEFVLVKLKLLTEACRFVDAFETSLKRRRANEFVSVRLFQADS